MGKAPQRIEKVIRLLCLVGAACSLFFVLLSPGIQAEEPGGAATPSAPAASASGSPSADQPSAPAKSEAPAETPSGDADEKKAPTTAAKTYVGSEACLECHEEYKDTFHRTLHGKDPSKSPTAANQCEACHGPGSVHVEDNEKSSIVGLKGVKPAVVNAVCQKCHETMPGQYEWRFSTHAMSNVSCTECHNVHPKKKDDLQPKLLRKGDQKDICYTCHAEVRGQTYMPSHHPIEEGRLTCSDCHNVHGAGLSKFKNAPNARELCLQCHQQYRGPFAVEHQPVSDDCANCHRPHGSMETNMLTMSEPFLCQRCHTTVHNPHVSPALTTPGQMADQSLFFSRCTTCHANVHGSEASPTFTR